MTAAERTRAQLCGQLSVEVDGVQVVASLRGRQVRLLLAYLLLHRRRPVGREELSAVLWPDQAPLSQDGALRTLLSRLRSALGADVVAGREEVLLALPEPVWVDFEAASAELARSQSALEQGDARGAWALAQVPLNIATRGLLPGTQADWLEAPRRELRDIRLEALEVVGAAGLKLGGAQLSSVDRAARSLIEAEPYRESGYTLLMQSHAVRGNVAEAIRVFDQLRTLLREELGTTPSAEAIAAHDQLLRGSTGAPTEDRQARGGGPIELPTELRARSQTALIGRIPEMTELRGFWDAARQPSPGFPWGTRLVVLAGEAGIGKTSLAAQLARQAHDDGAVVLAGRAPEEGLAPYQPFLEALSHYFATADLDEIRIAVREHGPELSHLVPELRRRVPDYPVAAGETESERYRLFEAVVGFLSSIAQRSPILLVLDDLHWADRPTLLLLRHLVRAPRPSRLLVLISYRTELAGEDLKDILAELGRDGLATQLDIGGLTQSETGLLISQRAGERPSTPSVGRIHRETEGNPFFIEEIVRHLLASGMSVASASASELQQIDLPEGVKRMVARRLARLHQRTVEALRVAAVAGRDFEADVLEEVLDLDEEEFLAALEEALEAGVLLEPTGAGGRYSFSHALIREALYEGMSAPRRARLHRRVGEALESYAEPSLSALARHFTRAATPQEADKAISYAVQAAEQASEAQAHEEAVEHLLRALEVLDRFHRDDPHRRLDMLLELGEACVCAGERRRAREVFLQAARLGEELGDTPRFIRAVVGAARRYVQQPGVVDEKLIELLDRALEKTAGESTPERVRLLARAVGSLYYSEQRERMGPLSQEAMGIAEGLGDPGATAYAYGARRAALWDPRHLEERLDSSTEMLTAAQRAGDLELRLQAQAWLMLDLLEAGDRDAVDAQVAAFTAGAAELGQPLYRWHGLVWQAMVALLEGDLGKAEEAAEEARAAGSPGETVTAEEYHAVQLAAIRREQGRGAELLGWLSELAAANPERTVWRAEMVLALCDAGQQDEARAQLGRLEASHLRELPADGDWMGAMAILAQVAPALGERSAASALYELLLPYADTNVVRGIGAVCVGPVARLLGRLAWESGRLAEAHEHFDLALEKVTALRSPVLVAHTQLDYAQALGRSPQARRLIAEAAEVAQELDLPAVAERAREAR